MGNSCKEKDEYSLSQSDSEFLSYLRSLSIFVIVFGHVGGFWVFRPYSEFLHVFIPIFFFISGAVSYYSYNRSQSILYYFRKRFVGLLVPYYLMCIFTLMVWIITNKEVPSLNIDKIILWLQIRPSHNDMPFPLGQVWFLHTLFIITVVSPIYFKIQNYCSKYLLPILFIILTISSVQLFVDISSFLYLFGNNLYKPLIHSIFYIMGIVYCTSASGYKISILSVLSIACVALSFFLVYLLKLDVDYANHTFAPDVYYVLGSVSAILIFVILKKYILIIVRNIKAIQVVLLFLYRHTFSIFLLHTFGIYVAENIFGLVEPDEKSILYGFVKLIVVITVTCVVSVPFSKISKRLSLTLL